MAPREEIEGICTTCAHACECRILERSQAAGKIVWHCEEFDDPHLQAEKNRECQNPVVMRSNNLIPGWDR